MTYVLLVLWALFVVAVLIISFGKSPVVYAFENYGKTDIPYVTIDIQGNLFNMIVDTGCGVSMLNKPSIKDAELLYKKSENKISLSALTPDSVEAGCIVIDFNIGKKKVSEEFYLTEHEDFASFRSLYNIEMHGLLGSSFFDSNNCRIDFENHVLIV